MVMVLVRMRVRVRMAMAVGVFVSVVRLSARVMGVIVLVGKVNVELDAADCSFVASREVKMVTVKLQLHQLLLELYCVDTQIDQRANEHVAADSTEEVQIKSFHAPDDGLLGYSAAARALIWLAAYPAPKPLSMFTTVIPLAQLLSIPSSAANPPKLAP